MHFSIGSIIKKIGVQVGALQAYAFASKRQGTPEVGAAQASWLRETQDVSMRNLPTLSAKGTWAAQEWTLGAVPPELLTSPLWRELLAKGPEKHLDLLKAFRAELRLHRKNRGELYGRLLNGLYRTAVLARFYERLAVGPLPCAAMRKATCVKQLCQSLDKGYATQGYKHIPALLKTDVQWLTQEFGEPSSHLEVDETFEEAKKDALARACWSALAAKTGSQLTVGLSASVMRSWLASYAPVSAPAAPSRKAPAKKVASSADLKNISKALKGEIIVADLETTGFSVTDCEILEIAAARVSAEGRVLEEFSVLVTVEKGVPQFISSLSGISNAEVARHGISLPKALSAFSKFVGSSPLFFHNAPFDTRFLHAAYARVGARLENSVFDTLPLARAVWPGLASYKLEELAKTLRLSAPSHRALADVRTTVGMLNRVRQLATSAPAMT